MNMTISQKSRHCIGGGRIRRIEKDSKATSIRMDKYCLRDNERIVNIIGTLQQIQTAKILLNNALKSRYRNSRSNPCNMKEVNHVIWKLTSKIESFNVKLLWSNKFSKWKSHYYYLFPNRMFFKSFELILGNGDPI